MDRTFRLKKKEGALVDESHLALYWAQGILDAYFAALGQDAVVTSGNDGKHSLGSAHWDNRAWDLRTWAFGGDFDRQRTAGRRIVEILNRHAPFEGAFYMVLEPDHFHLEWAGTDVRPNIKNYEPGVFFYEKKAA